MSFQAFDIVNAEIQFYDCQDKRPCLIIEILEGGEYKIFPIASHVYHGEPHFPLDQNDPDFQATGLTRSCNIHDIRFYRIHESKIFKKRGVLAGGLLIRFREYAGV